MKIKRILSFILAAALVLSCAPSYLPVAEAATETTPTVIYTAGDLGVENAVVVESFDAALAVVEAKNKQWKSNDIVEIRFRGDVSGGSQDGLLFGLTTIWREDGTKLPIILRGVDTKMQGDAYIYLDGAGGWYACANDYSFINLTLPIGAQATDFYAGSGNITFESVNFKKTHPRYKPSRIRPISTDTRWRLLRQYAVTGITSSTPMYFVFLSVMPGRS
jgi:hypothetical protein